MGAPDTLSERSFQDFVTVLIFQRLQIQDKCSL